ncbi:hypothetical protein ACFL21_02115 [Patescibacteria group bacterium]
MQEELQTPMGENPEGEAPKGEEPKGGKTKLPKWGVALIAVGLIAAIAVVMIYMTGDAGQGRMKLMRQEESKIVTRQEGPQRCVETCIEENGRESTENCKKTCREDAKISEVMLKKFQDIQQGVSCGDHCLEIDPSKGDLHVYCMMDCKEIPVEEKASVEEDVPYEPLAVEISLNSLSDTVLPNGDMRQILNFSIDTNVDVEFHQALINLEDLSGGLEANDYTDLSFKCLTGGGLTRNVVPEFGEIEFSNLDELITAEGPYGCFITLTSDENAEEGEIQASLVDFANSWVFRDLTNNDPIPVISDIDLLGPGIEVGFEMESDPGINMEETTTSSPLSSLEALITVSDAPIQPIRNGDKLSVLRFNIDSNSDLLFHRALLNFDTLGSGLEANDFGEFTLRCITGGNLYLSTTPELGEVEFSNLDQTITEQGSFVCNVFVDVNEDAGSGQIQVSLVDFVNSWMFRDAQTNDIASVVPGTDLVGQVVEIIGGYLEINLASSPTAEGIYLIGTEDVPMIAFMFETGDSDDLRVNSLSFIAGLKDNEAGYWDYPYVENLIESVNIYDGEELLGTVPLTYDDYDDRWLANFENIDWVIPAGESKKLLVTVDSLEADLLSGDDDMVSLRLYDVDAENLELAEEIFAVVNYNNSENEIYQIFTDELEED